MEVYIDGSQRRGRCGWACFWGDNSPYNISGEIKDNDNSCAKAEVYAFHKLLIEISQMLNQACLIGVKKITVHCDNIYVVKGVNEWMESWAKKGWKKSDGGTVAHTQLWQEIRQMYNVLTGYIQIDLRHVKAHNGTYGNECADQMAKGEWDTKPKAR